MRKNRSHTSRLLEEEERPTNDSAQANRKVKIIQAKPGRMKRRNQVDNGQEMRTIPDALNVERKIIGHVIAAGESSSGRIHKEI